VGECEVDEDCYYYIVGSINIDDPTCPADFLYVYFDNEDDAFEYASSIASTPGNDICGAPVVDSAPGRCCDNRCFPFFDSLPYFTNYTGLELECP
jgi:hypothetical protein